MKRLAANVAGSLCMAAMYLLFLYCLMSPQP